MKIMHALCWTLLYSSAISIDNVEKKEISKGGLAAHLREISSRQKRIVKIEAGMKKGKSTIDRRVRDLDKEKEKRDQ
ncbi:MAG: hypothetical protein ACW99U_02685 [Candidatus Thorarchaeota archaeon]|jgi:hypothetical protein